MNTTERKKKTRIPIDPIPPEDPKPTKPLPIPTIHHPNNNNRPNPVERAHLWLAQASPAVSGDHGHNHTLSVASSLVNGFELSDEDALALIESWNRSCDPPWEEKDLIRKIKEARKLGPPAGKAMGWLLNADRHPARSHFSAGKQPLVDIEPGDHLPTEEPPSLAGQEKDSLSPKAPTNTTVEVTHSSDEPEPATVDLQNAPRVRNNSLLGGAKPPWPQPPDKAAFHGLAGEVVTTIDPHAEADPVAVLIHFLSAYGNLLNSAPHCIAAARNHPARLWAVLVGETSKGRKGTAWAAVQYLLRQVDEHWSSQCVVPGGLSTGEGLIKRVRDPAYKVDEDGNEVLADAGVSDKRLLVIEEEFVRTIRVAAREQNTLSAILRAAWDSGDLQILTKDSPPKATGAHISVVAHITKAELGRELAESDAYNGFANRFLWLCVRRSKLLPEGGELHKTDLSLLIRRISAAVEFGRSAHVVERSADAKALWAKLYPDLTREIPGALGGVTSRAEAQVLRLSLDFALLDCSRSIEVVHLEAAKAVWDYCFASARYVFGHSTGDPIADRILDALRVAGPGGLPLTEIRKATGNNTPAARIHQALADLRGNRLASPKEEKTDGRPIVRWTVTTGV